MPVFSQSSSGLSSITLGVEFAAMAALGSDIPREVAMCPTAMRATAAYVTFYEAITCDDTNYKAVEIYLYNADGTLANSGVALAGGQTKATPGAVVLPNVAGVLAANAPVAIPLLDGAKIIPAGGSAVAVWTSAGSGVVIGIGARVSLTLEKV